jgi:hypothetical protein
MSHARYTRLVRNELQAQIARQEKELGVMAQSLCGPDAEFPSVAIDSEIKRRRSLRLAQKQRSKAKRRNDTTDTNKK